MVVRAGRRRRSAHVAVAKIHRSSGTADSGVATCSSGLRSASTPQIAATTAALYELVGFAGIGLTAAVMIFVGNPFSGVTSAPDLLPDPAGAIGRLLPPGAAGSLVRSTAYFDGHGASGPLGVLVTWSVLAAGGIVLGHARRERRDATSTPTHGADRISSVPADEIAAAGR